MPYQYFDPNLGYTPQGGGQAPLAGYHEQYDPRNNPYAWGQYEYAGPGSMGVDPNDQMYGGMTPYYGGDITAMAAGDRDRAQAGGLRLQGDLRNYTNYYHGQAGQRTNQADSAWSPIAEGRGGYTDQEREGILNNEALQGLRTSQGDRDSNYLTQEEQGGIRGDPMMGFHYAQEQGGNLTNRLNDYSGQIGADLGSQEESINRELRGSGDVMRNAVYDHQRKSYDDLSDIAGLTRGEVGNTREGVRSYIDPNELLTSGEYNANYRVSPEDMQGIVNQAGRQVGAQSVMDEEKLNMSANAQGNSNPLAMATMRNRIRSTGAVNSANAMADAAIKAKQLQLGVSQNREATRLGAEQNYANTGIGSEMALGQQGLANEQYMGSNTLSQQNNLAATQLGAEQYLASQNLAGQQYLGKSRLDNTQQLMQTGLGVDQYNANLGMGAIQSGEQAQSGREAALANTRLGSNQFNQNNQFQQGQAIYDRGQAANTRFADTRRADEEGYRKYLETARTEAGQQASVGNQQGVGAFNATNQGMQGGTRSAIENYKVPGMGERIAGMIPAYVSAFSGGLGSAAKAKEAGLFKEGGTMEGPTPALIGEDGPELVLDLPHAAQGLEVSDDPNSTMYRPSYVPDEALTQADPTETASKRKKNPLYEAMLKSLDPTAIAAKETAAATQFAKGGIAGKHHFYGSKSKLKGKLTAPKLSLVTKPTLTTLGVKGPQAIIPLTKRKGNKLGVSDIPALIRKYSGR